MIRVVIDTNILVSALLTSGGLPEAVIDLAISGDVPWFASESVLAEYEEVLKRPWLAIDSGKAAEAMARIRAHVSVVSPAVRVAAASDPDDNRFLECAEAAQAHYLVTGNIRHFPEVWKETRIVTPRTDSTAYMDLTAKGMAVPFGRRHVVRNSRS